MSWLFALTVIPLAVVLSGVISEFVAAKIIGADRAKYAAFGVLFGFMIAKAQPAVGEMAVDVPTSFGALIGLALLWWKLFRWERANG